MLIKVPGPDGEAVTISLKVEQVSIPKVVEGDEVDEGPRGYKAAVQECHSVLDAAGIPSAKGQVCSDPECKSPVGHRLRALRDAYIHFENVITQIRKTPNLPPEIVAILSGTKGH